MSLFEQGREHPIKCALKCGSEEDKKELQPMLDWEAECGEKIPFTFYTRLNPWVREQTQAYKTPTILKQWKDSLPAPVAVWFSVNVSSLQLNMTIYLDFDRRISHWYLLCLPQVGG